MPESIANFIASLIPFSVLVIISFLNEQIQNLTKRGQERRRPMRKGNTEPRPQEKKKCATEKMRSRRSMAFAALTIKLFKPK